MARSDDGKMFSMIRQWQGSGISQKAFCKKKDIAYATFHYWYKKFREVDLPEDIVPSFAPVTIADHVGLSFCSVRLPDGVVIDFHSPVPPGYLNQLGK
jgi:hypothetical protein